MGYISRMAISSFFRELMSGSAPLAIEGDGRTITATIQVRELERLADQDGPGSAAAMILDAFRARYSTAWGADFDTYEGDLNSLRRLAGPLSDIVNHSRRSD